jgi:hypothetical protein
MVVVAPLAGRWYDRSGGRPPLVVGFAVLAAAGVALALGVQHRTYLAVLPGLLLYGIGLAFVLSTNFPVSLDSIRGTDEGQASGVSATAEQGGGAIGIAVLYALFQTSFTNQLHHLIDAGPLVDLTDVQYGRLRDGLTAAEGTGLHPAQFDPGLVDYLKPAFEASRHGYVVAFTAMALIAIVGVATSTWLIRKPGPP